VTLQVRLYLGGGVTQKKKMFLFEDKTFSSVFSDGHGLNPQDLGPSA